MTSTIMEKAREIKKLSNRLRKLMQEPMVFDTIKDAQEYFDDNYDSDHVDFYDWADRGDVFIKEVDNESNDAREEQRSLERSQGWAR